MAPTPHSPATAFSTVRVFSARFRFRFRVRVRVLVHCTEYCSLYSSLLLFSFSTSLRILLQAAAREPVPGEPAARGAGADAAAAAAVAGARGRRALRRPVPAGGGGGRSAEPGPQLEAARAQAAHQRARAPQAHFLLARRHTQLHRFALPTVCESIVFVTHAVMFTRIPSHRSTSHLTAFLNKSDIKEVSCRLFYVLFPCISLNTDYKFLSSAKCISPSLCVFLLMKFKNNFFLRIRVTCLYLNEYG